MSGGSWTRLSSTAPPASICRKPPTTCFRKPSAREPTACWPKRACGFSDRYPQFTEKGAVILGVSKDSVASHKKFEEKYGLVFTLLADPERKVIEAYDVWKEKKNYGKVSMGVVRTTYLIDEHGVIIKANDKVKAADDPENMLKELA